MDGFFLEIVAEAEVAQHFKKGVMVRRATDVIDVAGAKTFLAGCCTSKFEFNLAEEVIFKLVHARWREQNRRVPGRHEYIARLSAVAL